MHPISSNLKNDFEKKNKLRFRKNEKKNARQEKAAFCRKQHFVELKLAAVR